VIAKTLGRGNPFNTVRATLRGLMQLRNPEEVLRLRRQTTGEQPERATV
jgi:small subunit ribosomal protein S5